LKPTHKQALVLGNGGAAKAVCFGLEKLGINYRIVSRNPTHFSQLNYSELTQSVLLSHPIIVNTTPLGMFPNINSFPEILYFYLTENHLLYDLVYNPEETVFLKLGKAQIELRLT